MTVRQEALTAHGLPWMFENDGPGLTLETFARENKQEILEKLLVHGSLFFRGFGTKSVEAFEAFARVICPELYAEYGDLPPERPGSKVYGATPYPPNRRIMFHNEGSHTPTWPIKQMFCCIEQAPSGGESPLVDGRRVVQALDPKIAARFAEKGLLYVRNFIPGLVIFDGFTDVSWQDFFRTESRQDVVDTCKAQGVDVEWLANGNLRTRRRAVAITKHPRTGETIWFNQIQLHTGKLLLDAPRYAELLAELGEDNLPRAVYYGDGSRIEDEVMAAVCEVLEKESVKVRMEAGDVFLNDNMLVAHGRETFRGPRKIIVAMGEMMSEAALV